jgi:hypothetical protein
MTELASQLKPAAIACGARFAIAELILSYGDIFALQDGQPESQVLKILEWHEQSLEILQQADNYS